MGRSGSPARRCAHALLALALAAGAGGACSTGGTRSAALAVPPQERIDPSFEPAFAALRAALDAHDDAAAERVLARILARGPDEPTRAHAEVYGRILRGRQLAGVLELALVATPQDEGATVELTLRASHPLGEALEVHGGAGTLRLLLTGLDAAGTEQRVARSVAIEKVERLRLPADDQARVRLGRFEVPVGGALAVEAVWDLRLPPGTIRAGGADFPINSLPVAGCETLRLAPWLPQDEVDPGELARYVESGGRAMPALIERAVRIAIERREEALDALTPVALGLPRTDMGVLVPALRWLSGRRELGADVEAWATWLEARAAAGGIETVAPGLQLPSTVPPRTEAAGGATVPGSGGERR